METIKRFFQEEKAATAVEYGLLIALVGLGIYGGAQLLGQNITGAMNTVGDRVSTAPGG